MTTKLRLLLIALLGTLLCGCSSDNFKVNVELDDMGTQNLRVVFRSDSGMTDTWLIAHDNKLKFQGHSELPTIVTLLDRQGQIIMRAMAVNGDHITARGKWTCRDSIEVSGTKLNEQWTAFRLKNLPLYAVDRRDQLDRAIEEYVRGHRSDLLSTVLLISDYGTLTNYGRTDSLIAIIDPDAKPAALLNGYQQWRETVARPVEQLFSMRLYDKRTGDFESLPFTGRTRLTAFWSRGKERDPQHRDMVDAMRNLKERYGERLAVADVLIDADSVRWHRILRNDSTSWQHCWAPGGPADQELMQLRIVAAPLYLVTDSTGNVRYRGNDIRQASTAIDKLAR